MECIPWGSCRETFRQEPERERWISPGPSNSALHMSCLCWILVCAHDTCPKPHKPFNLVSVQLLLHEEMPITYLFMSLFSSPVIQTFNCMIQSLPSISSKFQDALKYLNSSWICDSNSSFLTQGKNKSSFKTSGSTTVVLVCKLKISYQKVGNSLQVHMDVFSLTFYFISDKEMRRIMKD